MSTAVAAKDSAARRFDAWTRGYEPLPGIPDEFMDASGHCRPHWRRLVSALAAYEPNEMRQRFSAADRRIRSRGLSYRVAGEKDERVWPISRMPLLVAEAEWRQVAEGVVQRAELLERVLADVYGEGRLIAEGSLPAAAVTGSIDYVAAMRGVRPPGGRGLRLYAADIGRGPDGKWWVLGDRAQAPSGCGYALENRLVVSQAFPDLYAQLNAERLAPFFRSLAAGLKSAGERAEPRIGILSPGPLSSTYYEQAYLARYLGFLLVEGDDLVMREGRIFVRTIAGLKRCDVLWRHVDADWCDPLELNSSSHIGVPGLLEAIRQGGVAVENMPGTGMVESRAMLAFLPALARRLLGQDLLMPNIATWWCGQKRERERVLDEFDRISIAPAFGAELPALKGRASVIGEELTRGGTRAPARRDRRAGARLRRAGSRAPVDDAALVGRQARAAAVRPAGLLRRDPGRLAGDARRILPDLGPSRRARGHDGRRRRVRRRLGARRESGRGVLPSSDRRTTSGSPGCSETCRAGRPTISSGSAAISSGPKRPCASCVASAPVPSIRTRPCASAGNRWNG